MKYIGKYVVPVFLVLGLIASYFRPSFFADNTFLDDFINHEYINLMTVIVTVSMVSVVQLHMEYTRIERKFKKRAFLNSRNSVNRNALVLLSLLVASFVVAFIKGMSITGSDQRFESSIHVIALATIIECIWIMYELTKTAYTIASNEPIDADGPTGGRDGGGGAEPPKVAAQFPQLRQEIAEKTPR